VGILIDASVPIAWERGEVDVARWLRGREEEPFHLSVITASELLHGVYRAASPSQRQRRAAFVEAVIARFPVLPVDLPTARTHARIGAELATAGQRIGAHDLWLAAAALAHGLTLATANLREFERVEGLAVEAWT
jgi:predicted nucleic acid-binding protein